MPATADPIPPPPTLECAPRPARASAAAELPTADEWSAVAPVALASWDGGPDPLAATHGASTFRLLWDERCLHLRAEVAFAHLHVDPSLPLDDKAHGLWERDVAELFLGRGPGPAPYGEVEGSPLGQRLDYFIRAPRRDVDRAWRSGALVRAAVGPGRFTVEIAVPWAPWPASPVAPPSPPAPGLVLRCNILVAQGEPGARRYLAWSPTRTAAPDFHVPERFGFLRLG